MHILCICTSIIRVASNSEWAGAHSTHTHTSTSVLYQFRHLYSSRHINWKECFASPFFHTAYNAIETTANAANSLRLSASSLQPNVRRARANKLFFIVILLWCYQTCNWFWNISLFWKQLLFQSSKKARSQRHRDKEKERYAERRQIERTNERMKEEKLALHFFMYATFFYCLRWIFVLHPNKREKIPMCALVHIHHTPYAIHSLSPSQPAR